MAAARKQDKVLQVTGSTKTKSKSALAAATGTKAADLDAYAADASEKPVQGESLEALRALAAQLLDRKRAVTDAAQALKKTMDNLADIEERELPDLMQAHDMHRFDFLDATTGITHVIKLDMGWRVSMPPQKDDEGNYLPENAAKRKNVLDWLRTIGQGGSIKKNMEVAMGLISDADAQRITAEFKEAHPDLDPGLTEKIESRTLWSIVKKRKDNGEAVHEDVVVKPVRAAKVSKR